MSKIMVIVENIVILVVAFFVYTNTIFKCVYSLGYFESKLVLAIMLVGNLVIAKVLSLKDKDVIMNVVFCYGLGFGVYTLIAYMDVYILLCRVIVVISLVLILAFSSYVVIKVKKGRAIKILRGIVIILVVTTLILTATIIGAKLTGNLFPMNTSDIYSQDVEKFTLDNNMEIVSKGFNGEWEDLDIREKVEVLSTVAAIECNYLGIEKIPVKTDTLSENVLGSYDDSKRLIMVNISYIDELTAEDWIKTICHEAFHSYQYELIRTMREASNKNLLLFQEVRQYKYEFENYTSGSKNPKEYASQAVEVNADLYADSAWIEYEKRINDYLNKKEVRNKDSKSTE